MNLSESELLEKLNRRLTSLKAGRTGWDQHYMEVARYTQPRLGRSLGASAGAQLNNKLLDGRGIRASEILANGMYSGMSSPAMPWFKLTLEDDDLKEFQPVKTWLAAVEERLYALFNRTNFYTAQKSSYLELGVFGTAASVMLEHFQHGAVTHNLTAGEYWIGVDDAGVADTLLRRCDMTTIQLVNRFGDKVNSQVKSSYDRSDYQTLWPCYHAIEPNLEREPDKIDRTNKPFRAIYFQEGEKQKTLDVGGFDERPFWAPRWDVTGSDVYGRSPAMNALPDLRQLQLQQLRKQQGIDFSVTPALGGPSTLNNVNLNLVPRGYTAMAMADAGQKIEPLWDVQPQVIATLAQDIQETRQAVDGYFFADLFMAITNMPGVQPRNIEEVARRNEEKLTQLGPAVERNQNEQLRVAIDRGFGILLRTGQLPPPPDEIQGEELKVEFVSILAQMQRAIGVGSIERVLGFVGNMAGVNPEAIDKLDMDQAIDEYADRVGAPPSIIRSDDKVAEIRASRQQAMAAEKAAAMAQPVQQGAQAAKLLSETDGGDGASVLARMLGAA